MFKISIGSSDDSDTAEAVGALVAQCLSRFGNAMPKAGILYNNGHAEDSTVLRAIADTWPQMQLIGSATNTGEPRLTLMLLDSADLEFRVGVGRKAALQPELAAESALSQAAGPEMDRIMMCLTLPDHLSEWNDQFGTAMTKLLPRGTTWLNELLPLDGAPLESRIDRYYCGLEVLTDATPVLIAIKSVAREQQPGWMLTRTQGFVRRDCGDQVYEYDTLIGDRRRAVRAGQTG